MITLLILASHIFSPIAYANGLSVAAGGGYNQFRLPNASSGSSIYRGAGIVTDLRYRLSLLVLAEERRISLSQFAIEPFGIFQYNQTNNISYSNEKHEHFGFGGGIDLVVNRFLGGVQYQRSKSLVSRDIVGSNFWYDAFGFRLGSQFSIHEMLSSQIIALWQYGTALALDNGLSGPQPVYQLAVFVMLRYHFNTHGDRKPNERGRRY